MTTETTTSEHCQLEQREANGYPINYCLSHGQDAIQCRATVDGHTHPVFGKPFACHQFQQLTGQPCPSARRFRVEFSIYGADATPAWRRAVTSAVYVTAATADEARAMAGYGDATWSVTEELRP